MTLRRYAVPLVVLVCAMAVLGGSFFGYKTLQPPDAIEVAQAQQKARVEIVRYIHDVKRLYVDDWAAHLKQRDERVNPMGLRVLSSFDSGCGAALYAATALYCPPDKSMYMKPDGLDGFMFIVDGQLSKLGAVFALGHEYGHYLQDIAGNNSYDRYGSVPIEQQATCVAGALVKWLMTSHTELAINGEDLNAVRWAIWTAVHDSVHGDPRLLTGAYDIGFEDGLAACVPIAGPLAGV